MTQPDDRESLGKFEPSEAAMDQYRASRRRYFRVLVFLPVMFLLLGLQNLHVPAPILLVLLGVGFIVTTVIIWQNAVVAVRADRRLRAEKREWDAKRGGRLRPGQTG
jgi:hypothetical protein